MTRSRETRVNASAVRTARRAMERKPAVPDGRETWTPRRVARDWTRENALEVIERSRERPFVVEDTSSPRSLGRLASAPRPPSSSPSTHSRALSGSSSDSRASPRSPPRRLPRRPLAPVVVSRVVDDASTHRSMRDDLHLHPWIVLHTNTMRTVCPMYNTRHTARDLDRARPVDIRPRALDVVASPRRRLARRRRWRG